MDLMTTHQHSSRTFKIFTQQKLIRVDERKKKNIHVPFSFIPKKKKNRERGPRVSTF